MSDALDPNDYETERDGWLKLGVAAELAKNYAQEGSGFLRSLALMLQAALPRETEVMQRGGWFAKKETSGVLVTLGEDRLSLEDIGRGLRATRTRIVRGIALKTEEISVEEWLQELGATLDERARTNRATRDALEKMVW